jgi:ubiquinone/menaquinone biosynthesis C-methylase UbiE
VRKDSRGAGLPVLWAPWAVWGANCTAIPPQLGHEIWGVDASPKMIEICRRRFGGARNAHFLPGEAGWLRFPDHSFDGSSTSA